MGVKEDRKEKEKIKERKKGERDPPWKRDFSRLSMPTVIRNVFFVATLLLPPSLLLRRCCCCRFLVAFQPVQLIGDKPLCEMPFASERKYISSSRNTSLIQCVGSLQTYHPKWTLNDDKAHLTIRQRTCAFYLYIYSRSTRESNSI